MLILPPPLHRIALRLAHSLRKQWWRVAQPRLEGVRVLAFDAENRLLLVRHSYGSGLWMPPGGAIDRGETPVAAAMRELLEETACRLANPVLIAATVEALHGAGNHVHVVCGLTKDIARADQREIIEARFFPLDSLPSEIPQQLHRELPGWIDKALAALSDSI